MSFSRRQFFVSSFLLLFLSFEVDSFANCEISLLRDRAKAEDIAAAKEVFEASAHALNTDSLPEKFKAPAVQIQNGYLVGGEIKVWKGPMDDVYSPIRVESAVGVVTRQYLGQVPRMDAQTGLAVYENSRQAWNHGQGEWPKKTLKERIIHMQKFLDGMLLKRQELINLIMWEINKNEKLATTEVDRTIAYAKDTIAEAIKLENELSQIQRIGTDSFKLGREPLGVVPIFAPYNYPLNETFTNLIPALLMGNIVLVKPARYGVLLMKPLLELFRDSFPPGVVNFIYGDGREVFSKINEVGGYEGLGYIGGERGALSILQTNGAAHRTKATLGLGAKNMAVILNDANMELAISANLEGCLTYSGQRCTAHKILFVQRGIAEVFLNKFSVAVDNLKVGTAFDKDVTITASPDNTWLDTQSRMTSDALSKGARIANLSGGLSMNGIFSPTILVGVTPEMEIYNKEQFGSVIPVVVFDEISEVLAWQRQSPYGQQAAVFGQDEANLSIIVDGLKRQVGRININGACRRSPDGIPFGARANSGLGTLSLRDALLAFTTDSVLCENHSASQAVVK